MTFKEKYNLVTKWQHRANIISLYHHAMCLKKKKWSIRATAKYFDKSIGLISEDINLAKNLDLVKSCETRKDALLKLKTV